MPFPQSRLLALLNLLRESRWLRPVARRVGAWVKHKEKGDTHYGTGLQGMPKGLGDMPCGQPVALCWHQGQEAQRWLRSLIQDWLCAGPVFVVLPVEADADALLDEPAFQVAHAEQRLTIWLLDGAPHRLGVRLEELPRAGLRAEHALLIVSPTPLVTGKTVAATLRAGAALRHWCAERRRPVVLGHPVQHDLAVVLTQLHALPEVFQHIATFTVEHSEASWWVDRWDAHDAPVFQTRFGLRCQDNAPRNAAWHYDGSASQEIEDQLIEAPDQRRVIATREALGGLRALPPDWRMAEDWADAVAQAEEAVAATVLLHAGGSSEFQCLAQTVHRLRLRHPRLLKIIVRETRDKLRSPSEMALIALGASQIVYREVGHARLQRVVADLQDTVYPATAQPTLEDTLARYLPEPRRGYLPPATFSDMVLRALSASASTGLPHSLVRLLMQNHVAHLDALKACRAHRDGDLLTADNESVWVFLFGCAEADVDATLHRLFSRPVTELFASSVADSSQDGIRTLLQPLTDAARHGALTDHSQNLEPMPSVTATAILPPQASATAPSTFRPDLKAVALPRAAQGPASNEPMVVRHPRMRAEPLGRRKHPPQGQPPQGDIHVA